MDELKTQIDTPEMEILTQQERGDGAHQVTQVSQNTPDGTHQIGGADVPQAKAKRQGGVMAHGCTIFILCFLLIVMSVFCGMMGLYFLQGKGLFCSQMEGQNKTYFLDKKEICEMAFVQSGLIYDSHYNFTWDCEIPLPIVPNMNVEIGRATMQVKGIYFAKYGIDPHQIKVWDFYPETSELQVSIPEVKLLSLQTEVQEIGVEDESLLKKLQREERNEAMKMNREGAENQARELLKSDSKLKQECIDHLRKLLLSVGIKLVLVQDVPRLP
ncbi:MAG: hypothetical protein RSE01_07170 [Akkermansia sp.]